LPSSFIRWKVGDSFSDSRIQTDAEQATDSRNGMRQPQAAKSSLLIDVLHDQDDDQRQEQAKRRRRLDPGRVVAAAVVWRVFGDIGRRAAIFTAERQALQHAQPIRMIGAAMPQVAEPGSKPTRKVDRPMIRW
jgi:hypothetical protein